MRSLGPRAAIGLVLLVALVATGCAASPDIAQSVGERAIDDPRATSAPTETVSPRSEERQGELALPTVAASPTDSATPSPIAIPSPTATPTATPLPSPTPTPTAIPSPTATSTATPVEDVLDEALAASQLVAVNCPSEAQAAQLTCWIATLPVNVRSPRSGETVEILIAFVDNGDPLGVGPVVYLQGGPGVGAVSTASRFVGIRHDVLLVDQRGTGFSTPKLDCAEVDGLWQSEHTDIQAERLTEQQIFDAYEACRDRLIAAGISFNDFNTTAAATDYELIRRLMGYESWSLWGISYGTRTALTIMRDYPDAVRATVLDSVVPFEVDFFATLPENAVRAFEALDAACDATTCAIDHGDFFTNLSELTLRLNETPIVIAATRPNGGGSFPFRVDGAELLSLVFTQLYSTRSLPSLPRQISRADYGGIEELVASYVRRRDPTQIDLAEGLYYTTWCREEFPFHNALADDSLLGELSPLFGTALGEALSSSGTDRLCNIFAVAPADALYDQPIKSEIPTVVFAGAFDPVTPPTWSFQVSQALGDATFIELDDHGHGMATTCPADLRVAFLANPDAELDKTCVAGVTGPNFD